MFRTYQNITRKLVILQNSTFPCKNNRIIVVFVNSLIKNKKSDYHSTDSLKVLLIVKYIQLSVFFVVFGTDVILEMANRTQVGIITLSFMCNYPYLFSLLRYLKFIIEYVIEDWNFRFGILISTLIYNIVICKTGCQTAYLQKYFEISKIAFV